MERIPPHAQVTTSRLNIRDVETMGQAPGGAELTDDYQLDNIRSQPTSESGRAKQAGPEIESHAGSLGPSASLASRAPQPQKNKEFEPRDDTRGMLSPLLPPTATN